VLVAVGLAAVHAGTSVNLWHVALFFVAPSPCAGGLHLERYRRPRLDARVERTRSGPIPSGRLTVVAAATFLALQALIGLLVLLQFNRFTVGVGFASLAVVAILPFMKRVTIGRRSARLAFSWAPLMGWPATFARLDLPAFLLYAGAICWVIGYDTNLCSPGSRR